MGPAGHSLSGLTLYMGYITLTRKKPRIGEMALVTVFSNAPDFDLISAIWAGFSHANRLHHSYTHTLGFAVVCGLIAALITLRTNRSRMLWMFSLVASSVMVHLVGDYFTRDTSFPHGLMLFWPLYPEYIIGPSLFLDIHKASFINLFSAANFKATIHESLAFTPLLSIFTFVLLVKRRHFSRSGDLHEPN